MKRNFLARAVLLCFVFVVIGLAWPQLSRAQESGRVESLAVSVGDRGFHPGSGNYLRIKSYVTPSYQTATLRLRIYNSKGKYIFQKDYPNNTGGFLDYKWKGKPSKNNEAKVSARKYAKDGRYTVEVGVISATGVLEGGAKTCELNISSSAPGGQRGLAKAKTVPILTGDMQVDYMAEQICKAAKVTSSQSDNEKVRRIYHWMTKKQKHRHYYEGGSFKRYYNLAASKSKIKSYRKSTDKLLKKGKLIYNHDAYLIRRSWCMERRIGVCTDHAVIFKILCNHVGVEAGICSGYYLNRNGTKAQHSWNYAIADGKTWYYDVDVEIQNYGKGQGDYYWYRKSKSEAKQTHQFITED